MMKAKMCDDRSEETEIDGYLDYLSADDVWRAVIDAPLEDQL